MEPVIIAVKKTDLELFLQRLEGMAEPYVKYQDDKEAMQRELINSIMTEADQMRLFVRGLLKV